jgi:hypothetical protein
LVRSDQNGPFLLLLLALRFELLELCGAPGARVSSTFPCDRFVVVVDPFAVVGVVFVVVEHQTAYFITRLDSLQRLGWKRER